MFGENVDHGVEQDFSSCNEGGGGLQAGPFNMCRIEPLRSASIARQRRCTHEQVTVGRSGSHGHWTGERTRARSRG